MLQKLEGPQIIIQMIICGILVLMISVILYGLKVKNVSMNGGLYKLPSSYKMVAL